MGKSQFLERKSGEGEWIGQPIRSNV